MKGKLEVVRWRSRVCSRQSWGEPGSSGGPGYLSLPGVLGGRA